VSRIQLERDSRHFSTANFIRRFAAKIFKALPGPSEQVRQSKGLIFQLFNGFGFPIDVKGSGNVGGSFLYECAKARNILGIDQFRASGYADGRDYFSRRHEYWCADATPADFILTLIDGETPAAGFFQLLLHSAK